MKLITKLKSICRDTHVGYALSNDSKLLAEFNLSWGPFFLLSRIWWAPPHGTCASSESGSCTHQLSPLQIDAQSLAHGQNTAPRTVTWISFFLGWSSLLLEPCLSLEKAPALSLVFPSLLWLLPWSQQVRGSIVSTMQLVTLRHHTHTRSGARFSYSR